jgi:hypothetical protein
MSESELNGWGHFLLHPKVVQRRQGDEYFYAKWRPVLQASMARTSDPILLGRAVDLGLAEQSPCLEFVLNREDHDWLTLVDKTRHLQLVYYTVKHGLHAAMHNLVRMPTEPAATVAQFTERVIYCDFVPSAQDVIDDVLSLVGSLEQVVDRALRQGENLSELFSHLAPACVRREVSQVRFCEAKLLKSHDDQNTENEPVWCGRVREKCLGRYTKSEMSPIMGQSCASNVAKVQLPVTYWSVAELFEALEIEHYPRGILGAADMGIRIGSWLNRVAEVAHRLRCSGCDQLMSQDFTYAKFDAVYRSTVLSCNNNSGGEHDRSVYLSRCWNCSAETRGGITFIDNRDCRVKFIHGSFPDAPEYLVCRTCGASADQPKLAATRYDAYALIGRICPNCGCKPSHWIGDRRQRTCPDCSHEIVLSAKHEEWIKRHRSGVAAFWVVNQEPDGWWEDRPPVADKGVFNRKSKEQN